MSSAVRVLMKRDGMSRPEAEAYVADVMSEVVSLASDGFYEDAEWVFEHDLGLEPDYLIELL